jgi:hypothetical protein
MTTTTEKQMRKKKEKNATKKKKKKKTIRKCVCSDNYNRGTLNKTYGERRRRSGGKTVTDAVLLPR